MPKFKKQLAHNIKQSKWCIKSYVFHVCRELQAFTLQDNTGLCRDFSNQEHFVQLQLIWGMEVFYNLI